MLEEALCHWYGWVEEYMVSKGPSNSCNYDSVIWEGVMRWSLNSASDSTMHTDVLVHCSYFWHLCVYSPMHNFLLVVAITVINIEFYFWKSSKKKKEHIRCLCYMSPTTRSQDQGETIFLLLDRIIWICHRNYQCYSHKNVHFHQYTVSAHNSSCMCKVWSQTVES